MKMFLSLFIYFGDYDPQFSTVLKYTVGGKDSLAKYRDLLI